MVEDHVKKHFPNCQPMFGEMIEFIAQSTSDIMLLSNFHPDILLSNVFATALPLVHFSNLICSRALLVQVAGQQFKLPGVKGRPK